MSVFADILLRRSKSLVLAPDLDVYRAFDFLRLSVSPNFRRLRLFFITDLSKCCALRKSNFLRGKYYGRRLYWARSSGLSEKSVTLPEYLLVKIWPNGAADSDHNWTFAVRSTSKDPL